MNLRIRIRRLAPSFVLLAAAAGCSASDGNVDPTEGASLDGSSADDAADTVLDTPPSSSSVTEDGTTALPASTTTAEGESTDGEPDGSASTDAPDESSSTGDIPNQLPPTDASELFPWLEANSYGQWTAESGPHPSAGPHGGDVRTFVNDSLLGTLDSGAGEHEVGAAVVKELYGDDDEVDGWAVLVKVGAGNGGDNWYWYEIVGADVYADGLGVALCTGCHGDGVDQVLSPFPLQ